MNEEIIDAIIKSSIINMFIFITFFRVNGERINKKITIIGTIIQSICYTYMKIKLKNNFFMLMILSYFIQLIFMRIFIKNNRKSILVSSIISNTVVYILFLISLIIEYIPKKIFEIEYQTIDMVLTLIIETILIIPILNMKR